MFCHEESPLALCCVFVSYNNNIKSKTYFCCEFEQRRGRWDAIMLDVPTKIIFEIDRHSISDVCIYESI